MDSLNLKFIYTGIFFLFILLSGFWVSRSGKPYNGLIFNIHKFIGLGVGVFLIRTVYLTHQAAPLNATQWATIVITVLLFILTVIVGGLLSILAEGGLKDMGRSMQATLSMIHKFFPYGIMITTAATLYLLLYQ